MQNAWMLTNKMKVVFVYKISQFSKLRTWLCFFVKFQVINTLERPGSVRTSLENWSQNIDTANVTDTWHSGISRVKCHQVDFNKKNISWIETVSSPRSNVLNQFYSNKQNKQFVFNCHITKQNFYFINNSRLFLRNKRPSINLSLAQGVPKISF